MRDLQFLKIKLSGMNESINTYNNTCSKSEILVPISKSQITMDS